MREVTKKVISAFLSGKKSSVRNTKTDGESLYLYDNLIAYKTKEGIMIRTAGWNTATTRERLNGIPGVRVNTKNHVLFLNGKPWDGTDTLVR